MASAALRHPIRVRALEAMILGQEVSAISLVKHGFGKDLDVMKGRTFEQQQADWAYHLRALEKANCVHLKRKVPRRGAWEKFYRANAIAYFSDEEWAAMAPPQRREISRVVAQGFIVQIEGAIIAGTFDSRPDRWLVWEPLILDERGWRELATAIGGVYAEVKQIKQAAKERLDAGGDEVTPMRATFGIASFESPELPELPKPDDAEHTTAADGRM
jgi:hypothetical protein